MHFPPSSLPAPVPSKIKVTILIGIESILSIGFDTDLQAVQFSIVIFILQGLQIKVTSRLSVSVQYRFWYSFYTI